MLLTLEDQIVRARSIVARAKVQFSPKMTFALFSGGNDSTAMLHIVRDLVDAAVHINTGIGIKATREFVRKTAMDMGVALLELTTPPEVYRDIVLGATRRGFPGPGFHFICYHRLKSQRLQNLQRDYAQGRGSKILLVSGVRSSESARRLRHIGAVEIDPPRGRLSKCAWANPIVHFDHRLLNEYRQTHAVPRNEVADLIHKSGECLCGAFAKPGELEEIEMWFPDDAAYIRALEAEAAKLGKEFPKWGAGSHRTKAPARRDMPLCNKCQMEFALP
jgi:3'-phosphoadenosine 5'-phosphosulfate sulfotransferase (PAPS reductase)/FAD synthetase